MYRICVKARHMQLGQRGLLVGRIGRQLIYEYDEYIEKFGCAVINTRTNNFSVFDAGDRYIRMNSSLGMIGTDIQLPSLLVLLGHYWYSRWY